MSCAQLIMFQVRLVICPSGLFVSPGNADSLEYLWQTRYLTVALTHPFPTPLLFEAGFSEEAICRALGATRQHLRSTGNDTYPCAASAVNCPCSVCQSGWLRHYSRFAVFFSPSHLHWDVNVTYCYISIIEPICRRCHRKAVLTLS